MGAVYVYEPDAEDFDCLGLCGPLDMTLCQHTEVANDLSEIEFEHPIDDAGRWSYLLDGYVLKADVPVRTCPEIESGTFVTSIETWTVKAAATKAQRYIYSKSSGGSKLKLLKPGDSVYVVAKGITRYKCKTGKTSGWIAIAAIDYSLTTVIDDDPAAIEAVAPAWSMRPQLFRIYSTKLDNSKVTGKARHISYDLLGNLTTWSGYVEATKENNPTCITALAGIMDNCIVDNDFEAHTNIADQRVNVAWTRVNPISALLDPDEGLVARYGGELVRDNWDLYVLDEAGVNRGARIEYGRNLTGIECNVDTTGIVTRIMPIGRTKSGGVLELVAGTYTVDGVSVVIPSGAKWVDSTHIADYAVPHVYVLDLADKAKATGTSAAALLAARVVMIRAALAQFAGGCDIPTLSLKVDFLSLGDAVEYAQYKELENIYLYDYVTVKHSRLAVDALAKVKKRVFDCLLGKFVSSEFNTLRVSLDRQPVMSWQIATAAVTQRAIGLGVVSAAAISEEVQNAMLPVACQVVSADGPVLYGISPDITTTLSARAIQNGVDITDTLDAAVFVWARNSGDAVADAAWNAENSGVKAITISAYEFEFSGTDYSCVAYLEEA